MSYTIDKSGVDEDQGNCGSATCCAGSCGTVAGRTAGRRTDTQTRRVGQVPIIPSADTALTSSLSVKPKEHVQPRSIGGTSAVWSHSRLGRRVRRPPICSRFEAGTHVLGIGIDAKRQRQSQHKHLPPNTDLITAIHVVWRYDRRWREDNNGSPLGSGKRGLCQAWRPGRPVRQVSA